MNAARTSRSGRRWLGFYDWHLSLFRFKDAQVLPPGGDPAALFASLTRPTDELLGEKLATWQSGPGGLDWLDEIVAAGKAVMFGNGYPTSYVLQVCRAIGPILSGPPKAHETWKVAPYSIVTDKWLGKTTMDKQALNALDTNEWLVIEAWDET